MDVKTTRSTLIIWRIHKMKSETTNYSNHNKVQITNNIVVVTLHTRRENK